LATVSLSLPNPVQINSLVWEHFHGSFIVTISREPDLHKTYNQKPKSLKGNRMNRLLKFLPIRLAVAAGLAASTISSHAQGESASGTVSGVQSGSDYDYTITLLNTSGSVTIDGFWYAWVPGEFYLPSDPTSASAPAGWTASIIANSIQYSGGSLAPGASINFSYVATFAPSALTGTAGFSYVYHSGLDSGPDTGSFLNVQTVAAPEPSSVSLLMAGLIVLIGLLKWSAYSRKFQLTPKITNVKSGPVRIQ
jgi:hypothetical protein